MSSEQEENIIKNPERNKDTVGQDFFAPQYQILGINPHESNSETNHKHIGLEIPNVGNNSEHLWGAVENKNDFEQKLDEKNYLVIANNKIIFTGNLPDTENKVKSIFYGEDEFAKKNNISFDDILVLKKVNIKIGVFIED